MVLQALRPSSNCLYTKSKSTMLGPLKGELGSRSKFGGGGGGEGWQGRRTSYVSPSLPPPLIFKAKFQIFVTLPPKKQI